MHRIRTLASIVALCCAAGLAWCAEPQSVSVKDFGAKGDGVADDTDAIKKAIEAAGSNGIVRLPPGGYLISDSLVVPPGATLTGESPRWENQSARLVVRKTGFSAVRLNHVSSVKGLCISYPDNGKNAKPIEYPPAILLEGINPSVENIHFDCAWDGISTPPKGVQSAQGTGQAMISQITGFVHNVGIRLAGIRDIVRIQDVHWFVGGDSYDKNAYFVKNRVGFEMGDVDGLMMDRCFIIGGKTFFRKIGYDQAPDGKKNTIYALGFHIDECWIEDVDNGFVFEGELGFVLENSNILVRDGGVGVSVKTESLYYNSVISGVQVRGFTENFTGIEYDALTPHVRNRLSIADCQIAGGAPCVRLMSGARRVNLHDCHLQGGTAVKIDRGADLLVITNNIFTTRSEAIEDASDKKATKNISGNLVEKLK